MPISMVRGVLFDLFHTLTAPESEWSSLPWTSDVLGIERRVWNELLTISSRWRLAGEEKDPYKIVSTLARQVDPAITDEIISRAVEVRIERMRHAITAIPANNIALLKALKAHGVRTALVSNADAMEITAWPDSPLAGLFDAEVFSCEVGLVKPERAIFDLALERIGLVAADCLFVGDGGANELVGAREAGLRTVFVSSGISAHWPEVIGARAASADYHVDHVEELQALPLRWNDDERHQTSGIRFRRITESDLPTLVEWLHRPHVAAWWDDQTSLDQVRAKYLPRINADSTVVPYIAYRDGEAIGYIQSYVLALESDGWWPDETDLGVRGIDQFLACEDQLNQGLGSAMVAAFVQKIFEDPAVTRVQTDPSPTNPRAIRCYEKAGFHQIGLVDTPNGQALLMQIHRPSAVVESVTKEVAENGRLDAN